jgi:hypothetical protein
VQAPAPVQVTEPLVGLVSTVYVKAWPSTSAPVSEKLTAMSSSLFTVASLTVGASLIALIVMVTVVSAESVFEASRA